MILGFMCIRLIVLLSRLRSLYSTIQFPYSKVQPDDSATHGQSWTDKLCGQLTDFLANMNETSTFSNVLDQMILDLSSPEQHNVNEMEEIDLIPYLQHLTNHQQDNLLRQFIFHERSCNISSKMCRIL